MDDFRRSLSNELLTQKVSRVLDKDTENRAKAGVSESLVRLSVGIEPAEQLINDIQQALVKIK